MPSAIADDQYVLARRTKLARLREGGVRVLWIAGNHDCWGGDVLRNDVGLDQILDGYRVNLDAEAGFQRLVDSQENFIQLVASRDVGEALPIQCVEMDIQSSESGVP